jgi:hypothetical protein
MRRLFTILLLTVLLALGVTVASAQPPIDGTFKTQDGDFLEGRYSVSWPGANDYRDIGNRIHLESFDGSLGTEWRIYCPMIAAVIPTYNNPLPFPDSYVAGFQIIYAGGFVWLDGGPVGPTSPPWSGGDADYSGSINTYIESRGIQVLYGTLTGLNSNHAVTASVNGYSADCITWAIGNTAWLGATSTHGPKPADYPAFLDAACAGTLASGHWGTATDLTLTVNGCQVATEETTWGSVKAKYK